MDYAKTAGESVKPLGHGKDSTSSRSAQYVDDLRRMMVMKAPPNSHGFVSPRQIEHFSRDHVHWLYRQLEYERPIEDIGSQAGVRWTTMEEIADDGRRRFACSGTARPHDH
jgi:peptidoglycan-N-acetylglucosamine deacetylase